MKLTIAGTGYVGLVTGTGFANLGNDVICFDIDQKKIDTLKNGIIPIYEPGLKELFERNVDAGRLKFTIDARMAVQDSEIIFICVNTPSNEHQEADLTAVKEVAKAVGQHMNEYKLIVNSKSVLRLHLLEIIKEPFHLTFTN